MRLSFPWVSRLFPGCFPGCFQASSHFSVFWSSAGVYLVAAARSTLPLVDNMLPSCPHTLSNVHYNSHDPLGLQLDCVCWSLMVWNVFINWEDWVDVAWSWLCADWCNSVVTKVVVYVSLTLCMWDCVCVCVCMCLCVCSGSWTWVCVTLCVWLAGQCVLCIFMKTCARMFFPEFWLVLRFPLHF